jgi:hypothetical protein
MEGPKSYKSGRLVARVTLPCLRRLLRGHFLFGEVGIALAEATWEEVLLQYLAKGLIFNGVLKLVCVVAIDETGHGR